jgi:chemotaxis protein CheX
LIDDGGRWERPLRDHLEARGCTVVVAGGPLDAYRTLCERDVRLVVVNDRVWPDGAADLVRSLRMRHGGHDLAAVVLVAPRDDAARAASLASGASAVVDRDVDDHELFDVVDRLAVARERLSAIGSLDGDMARGIIGATVDVFRELGGLLVEPTDGAVRKARAQRAEVIGSIAIAGCLCGSISLFLPRDLARRVAANMLGTDLAAIGVEELTDAIGELTNVIGGTIKTALFPRVPLFDVSVPSVYEGKDLQRCTVTDDLCFFVTFASGERSFAVELLLLRTDSASTTGVQRAVLAAMPA